MTIFKTRQRQTFENETCRRTKQVCFTTVKKIETMTNIEINLEGSGWIWKGWLEKYYNRHTSAG